MFYIDRKFYQRRGQAHDLLHVLPVIVVFCAFFGITLWAFYNTRSSVEQNEHQTLDIYTTRTKSALDARIDKYNEVLRAASGFLSASEVVTADEWKRFTATFELTKQYPGMLGFGYAPIVKQADKQTYIDEARRQFPDYTIWPEGNRNTYVPVKYVEYQAAASAAPNGYDMFSDVTRRTAMDEAIAEGGPALTSALVLLRDQQTTKQPGFIIYVPVYTKDDLPQNSDQRKAQTMGFVFASFRSSELLRHIDVADDTDYGFRVDASFESDAKTYYQSKNFTDLLSRPGTLKHVSSMNVGGQNWQVESLLGVSDPAFSEKNRPAIVFWVGTLLSFVLAGFIYLLLLNRINELTYREQLDIKQAKDELLALASHQLRTPATGVKQYICLLRDGYAGKLTKEQREYLEKAYKSNERQLSTINEMLTVARADAGTMKFAQERFDLASLVREIVTEMHPTIQQNKQSLKTSVPTKKLCMIGDENYLRMAIENVISNATKYTRSGGRITVTLAKKSDRAVITVLDTGVGVAEQDLPLLFLKFSRIPNELTKKVTGSGIGLYLAKTVVEATGGSITFSSDVGVGSTCAITLPLDHDTDYSPSKAGSNRTKFAKTTRKASRLNEYFVIFLTVL